MKNKFILLCVLSGFSGMFDSSLEAEKSGEELISSLTPKQEARFQAFMDKHVNIARCLKINSDREMLKQEGVSENSKNGYRLMIMQEESAGLDCSSLQELLAARHVPSKFKAILESLKLETVQLLSELGKTAEEFHRMREYKIQKDDFSVRMSNLPSYLESHGVDAQELAVGHSNRIEKARLAEVQNKK